MIQILGIRSFVNDKGETKKYDAFYDKNWRAPSLAVLLSDIDKYVDAIPTKERWNKTTLKTTATTTKASAQT